MPFHIYIAVAFLLVLGLALAWVGLRRIFSLHPITGAIEVFSGVALIALSVFAVGAALNLFTYQRLVAEQDIGDISFTRYAPQEFIATLSSDDGQREFSVYGDECQIDARIIKWQGISIIAGLDTVYRLERITGRYKNINDEKNKTRTVYPMAENAGIELWELIQRFNNWLPWVDATYGNAVYIPMADKAEYKITMSASGLVARPANQRAENILKKWK